MRTFTQKLAFLLVTLLCFAGVQLKAEELTVADGTATNSYLPLYGLYLDEDNAHGQCLYPADMLNDLAGGSITQMTFYLSSQAGDTWDGTYRVSLGMTSESSLSSSFISNDLTEVYSGTLDATGSTMVVVFDTPFEYSDGNLVVDFATVTADNYSSATFYGTSATGAGRYHYESWGSPVESSASFLLKVTFGYEPGGGGVTCAKPTLVTSDTTAHGITLTWGDGSGTYNVEYKGPEDADYISVLAGTQETTVTLSNLQPNTSYTARVQSICETDSSSWASKSFKTAIGLPYSETFSSSSTPAGWNKYSGLLSSVMGGTSLTSATSGWSFGTRSGVFDSHAYINVYGTDCKYWLVTPALTIDVDAQLTFNVALTAWNSSSSAAAAQDDKFVVLVTIDGGTTWTILQQWDNAGSEFVYNDIATAGEEITIDLSAYSNGDSVRIAFYAESTQSNGDNDLHIDNVLIEKIPTCLKPVNLDIKSVSKNSAEILWDAAGTNETAWKLQCKKSADKGWPAAIDVPSNPYTLEGLEAFTAYDVRIAAVCDAEDISAYSEVLSFRTAAGVPYHEGFGSSPVYGWGRYSASLAGIEEGTDSLVAVNTGWGLGSVNGVFPDSTYHAYLNITGANCHYWFISPVIELEDNLQLSFDLALTKATGTLQRVDAGAQDSAKFAVLITKDGGESWERFADPGTWDKESADRFDDISYSANGQTVVIDLGEYAGEKVRIAFYGEAGSEDAENYLHLSNVNVDYVPDCEGSSSLEVAGVAANEATLSWDEIDGALWEFACIANPAASFVPADADFVGSTGESSVTLDTLAENTSYTFYLRRNCEGARSSVKSVKIHTIQVPASLPYADDFESANNWVFINGDLENAWAWGTAANNGGTHALYVSNDGGTSNAYATGSAAMVYATKSFELEENATYTFKYDWKANGESGYDYLRVALVPASVVLEAATSAPTGFDDTHLPTGWIALDGGSQLQGKSAWQTFSTDLEVQAGTYVVVLAWTNDGMVGSQAPAAVDNFSISVLNCARPANLRAIEDGITTNSVLLTWDPEGAESNWLIRYKKASAASWTEIAEPIVNDTFNLEGLEPASVYSIEVAAWCDPTDSTTISEYSDAISVATECGVVASFPWHADFEDMPASTVPVCWDNSASTTEDKSSAYVWGVYESNGNKMIRMNNYLVHTGTALINTPSIILPESGAYELSFDYAHNASCGDFTVKASIDGGANWTDLQSYTKGSGSSYSDPGEFTEAVINLAAYAGDTILLQFFTNANYGNGAIFVDNLDIHVLPACAKPTGLAVELTQGNGTIATLSWDTLDAHAWVLQYGLDAEFANAQEVEVDTAYASLTGLTPESTYYARVKSACDEGGESPWSATLSFVPTNAYWMSINNGTTASSYIPITMYYADGGASHGQFIIPADSLKDIQWAVIDQLTFYTTASTADIASDRFEVYVAEVEATTLSSMAAWTSLNKVKNASALAIEGGKMVVSLDAPFVYEGGNLLIGFKQTAGSDYASLYWYGISAPSGASYYSYYDSDYSYTSSYPSSFLPKVTFGYMPGQEPACLKVQNIQASKRTASSAEISWTKGAASQNAWQIAIDTLATFDPDSVDLIDVVDTFYTFTGLEEQKTYYVYVRANCGAEDGVSAWSARASFVTTSACEKPADVKADSITTTSALISWETFGLDSFLLRYRAGSTGAYDTLGVHCPVLLDGLTPATIYYVQVKAACDTTNLAAKWTTAIRFSTDCEPIDTLAWHEGFESMTTGSASSAAPLCWSILNANDGAYPYIFVNNNSSYVKTGSKSLYFQSSSTRKGYAILPEFQMAANKLRVIFSYRNEGVSASNGTLSFGYMTDITEDSSFVEIASYPQTTTFTEVVAYCNSIPDSLASSARLAFCYTGGTSNNYYLGIDDITVEEIPACVDVADIEISGRTANSAVISWTNGAEDQDAWQIAMSTGKTFNPDDELAPIEVTSIPYTLNELIADTTYYLYVRANCGGGEYSAWSKLVSFKTARECERPDDLKADSITLNSARISWYGYGLTNFNLRYGQGSVWSDTIENIAMPYVLEGLKAGSAYNVQVQAACGSEWSSTFSVKTAFATPFEEAFDASSKPANWNQYLGQLKENGTANLSSGSGWIFGTGYNGVFDSHAYSNIYGTGCYKWLATPSLLLTDSALVIFDLALTKFSGTLTPVTAGGQPDDKFAVLISTNNGESWSVLRQWDNAGSEYVYDNIACSATGERDTIDISAYAGQSAIIAFYGESTVSNGDNNLHIDNVSIGEIPSCYRPTKVSVSDVLAHSAEISWTKGDSIQNAWQIAIDTIAGFDPDSADVLIDADSVPFVLSGLDAETKYYFYVRANCGEGDFSSWSARSSFRTDIACHAPDSLKAVLTPGDGSVATIQWYAADASAWVLEYSVNADFSDSVSFALEDASIELSELVPETKYYARVKAVCGGIDGESAWSTISFVPTDAYELTLNDGTTSNDYVPVYGLWADSYTRSQFVIPAADLASIQWDTINQLTFYASQASVDWGAAQFEVYMAEVPAATISDYATWSNLTKVMNAGSLSVADGQMVVELNAPYQYQGGNLLIGFKQTATGTYKTSTWYGKTAPDASVAGYSSSEGADGTATQRNFLPKLTITYSLGEVPSCDAPTDLNASAVTENSAVLNWTSDANAWELVYSESADFDPAEATPVAVSAKPYELGGLNAETTYYFAVRSVCGPALRSAWSDKSSFATPASCQTIIAEADSITLCPGEDYEWNDSTYAVAGEYHKTLISVAGCDSIVTLVLSFYEKEDSIFRAVTIKEDQLPYTYQDAEYEYVGEAITFPVGTSLGEHTATAQVWGEHCVAVLELTLTVEKSQGIDNIFDLDGKNVQKVLYRDVLYIVINNEWYNAEGKKVNKPE